MPRAILVVICWDPREAALCRRVIPTGHPGFDLYPIVVDPMTFPSWEDASPYLVILAGATKAIDLATPSGRDAVLTAIEQAGASHADTAALSTIILGVADAAARAELEALMASPKVIKARGLDLTSAQLNLVTSCSDLSQLAAWFDQALDAKTADEIFAPH